MKRAFCFVIALLTMLLISSHAWAQFGDFKSVTLTTKAWQMLAKSDHEKTRMYTQKCLELYSDQAKKMQESLSDFPMGEKEEIFSYWALNDVATSLFIEGKSYLEENKVEEAEKVFKLLIEEYTYGQCWDPSWQGFWKPAEAAQELLDSLS